MTAVALAYVQGLEIDFGTKAGASSELYPWLRSGISFRKAPGPPTCLPWIDNWEVGGSNRASEPQMRANCKLNYTFIF